MPSLSYPYSFQCKECGEQMKVTRDDARRTYDDPDSHNALKAVLKERRWVEAFGGMFCPVCAGEDE
jgi:type III secretory pathway component EscU